MHGERAYEIIDAYWAWEHGVTGAGVEVTIIDTGVDFRNHSARDHLKKKFKGAKNFSKAKNYYDEDGHGTMMSGIAAATKHPGYSLRGIATEARCFNARVIAGAANRQPETSALLAALDYAVAPDPGKKCSNEPRVALAAVKMPEDTESLVAAIRDLTHLLVVLSAGDLRDELPSSDLSELDNVIVVGAVTNTERYVSQEDPEVVHLAAPGQAVPSVGPKSRVRVTGSSAAAAFVAGAAALYFEKYPEKGPEDAKKEILDSCRRARYLSGKVKTSGILNLPGLLDLT